MRRGIRDDRCSYQGQWEWCHLDTPTGPACENRGSHQATAITLDWGFRLGGLEPQDKED